MLNLASLQKMKQAPVDKSSVPLITKRGSKVQGSSKSTKDKFVSVLVFGEWVACKDVIARTGFTQGTISRAAAHLVSDKVIVKRALQEGRCKNAYYKLIKATS